MFPTIIREINTILHAVPNQLIWHSYNGCQIAQVHVSASDQTGATARCAVGLLESFFENDKLKESFQFRIMNQHQDGVVLNISTTSQNLFDAGEAELKELLATEQAQLTTKFATIEAYHDEGVEMIRFNKVSSEEDKIPMILKFLAHTVTNGGLRLRLQPEISGQYAQKDINSLKYTFALLGAEPGLTTLVKPITTKPTHAVIQRCTTSFNAPKVVDITLAADQQTPARTLR